MVSWRINASPGDDFMRFHDVFHDWMFTGNMAQLSKIEMKWERRTKIVQLGEWLCFTRWVLHGRDLHFFRSDSPCVVNLARIINRNTLR